MALNQLKFDQLETGSVYPITASYALSSSAGSGGTTLITGSTYPITSSWSNYSISSSNSISSSYSFNSSTSSFSSNSTSASYSSTASVALNALTASYLDPISQSLIPSTGSTYSLGSPTNKWKDLYVSTGSIYIGDTVLSTSGSTLFANASPVVTLNTASGQIEVSGITASLSASYSDNSGLLNNTSSTIFATTGSNIFNGNQTVQGNITVVGSLIAQQYVVSSSVSYFTSSNFDGSTKFGDTESDIHQFTGSLRSPNITGSLLGTSSIALIALTSSYINVATNAVSSSFANTASVSISSSFASTSSYNLNSISSSYSLTSVSSSYSNVANTATSATSANTATSSSYATTAGTATSATSATSANSATSASYALTASFALNASGGGGSGTVSGSANYISKFTSGTAVGNSVIYETGSNIGIGTINPNAKLNINSSGSLVSGSVVFSVEGTQGSLFSVDDSLSGSLMSVNDISGLPILEVFSDDRLVVGTYNANTLVVTGSRVGIGTSVPVAKLQVSGNISGSSFTSSVSSGVGFLGTSSFASTASYALNALTASFALNASGGGGGGSGTVTGSVNYISKFTTTTTVGNSVIYETGSNIGIGTINPNAKLNINSSGSLASGSVVFSVEGTQGSLFSVDDSLSGSLMSVNDISGLPILEVFSDDRLVVGTYNSNALVVTGSRVGIGTNNPVAKLQVNGNISGSSFTGSVFGTSSWANNALSASYAPGGGTTLTTGSTYPITSSWAATSSNIIGGTSNYIPLWSTNTSLGNSVLYQNSSNIGIGTTSPVSKLEVVGNISASSLTGSVFGTSSWANNSISSSFSNTSTSSSFASTASYNLNSISSSYALTASFALNSAGGGGSISYITGSPVVGQYIVVSGSSTTQYTLTQSVSNPEHLLVSVNGVVQNYSSSYTVTGSTINFYQPYSDGDEIDVRFLNGGTTVQTGSIAGQTILYNFSSSQESTLTGLNLTGNKWGVNVIEEWNSGSGDIYYPSCSLLLHFSGSNNSTTFTDSGPNNLTVTSNNGAVISTTQNKFSGTSGFFDGTDDYLSINYNSVFNFGTDAFTWESWIYPTNISGIDGIYATSGGSGVNPKFVIHLNAGTPSIHYNNLTNGNDIYTTATSTVSINTWTHLAFVRSGSNWTWYINGNSAGSGTNNTNITFTSQPTYIGYGGESYFTPFNGYIDELRVTKGVARYTASFVTQSVEFPNQLPQYETKYIGLVGGLNDTGSDYGIQKLSDSSLKIRKMSVSGTPVSGSPVLSSSVDRVYVNVLNYDNVSISGSISNAVTASFVVTSSYALTTAPRTVIYRYGTTSVVNPGSYTNTIIKYDTAVTDSTGWYDNTNGRFTPTVSGWYQVSAGARVYGGSSTIEGYFLLVKNGIPNQIAVVGGQGFVNGLISLLVYFNGTTDYIQLYSNTNSAITNAQSITSTPFTMVYMSP
jgi:hypothetical protein